MFRNMTFGMFENMAFGELPEPLQPYADDIKYLINFSPVTGYIVLFPKAPMPSGKALEEYKEKMNGVVQAATIFMNSYKTGDVPLKHSLNILQDIDQYVNFLRLVYQQTVRPETMEAYDVVRTNLFGSYENYRALKDFLSNQSALARQDAMNQATLLVSQVSSQTSNAKLDFYTEVIFPLAKNFSQSDQYFLRTVFINTMDGEVTLPDLLRALTLLKPYLTPKDIATVYQFAYKMILGSDYASNVLNVPPELSDVPYGSRNVNAEIAAIRSQYSALASRLTPYLDPNTDAWLEQRLKIHNLAYQYPNDSQYNVCGEACDVINKNIFSSITDTLNNFFGVTPNVQSSDSIVEKAKLAIQEAVQNNTNMDEKSLEEITSKIVDDAKESVQPQYLRTATTPSETTNKSSVGMIAVGAFLLFLLFSKKEQK